MLKDFMTIFKNSKNEFYKDKYKAAKLLKRVKYIKSLILEDFEKNKEILNYLDTNMYYFHCEFLKQIYVLCLFLIKIESNLLLFYYDNT